MWDDCISRAMKAKATMLQIAAVVSLAESEFKHINLSCVLTTGVDRDGDLMLSFLEILDRELHLVRVAITPDGFMETFGAAGEHEMFDPYAEAAKANDNKLIWIFNDNLFKRFYK